MDGALRRGCLSFRSYQWPRVLPCLPGRARPATVQLVAIPQYTYEADANRLCKGDTVVWGSSAHKGIYYVKGAGPQRIGGFYACKADVKKAGYKILE